MVDVQKLKCFRIARNLTQADVANAMNVAPTTYGRYERGLIDVPPDVLNNLANYFGVSVDELYV